MKLAHPSEHAQGVAAAFLTPLLLGVAPIFGKQAIGLGADPFTVAAVRTVIAALLLWVFYIIFLRKSIFIYPAGLLGCVVVGVVNGIGSLFYYSGLGLARCVAGAASQRDVSGFRGAALALGRREDRPPIWRCAWRWRRLALVMLTGFGHDAVNWLGVGLMLGSALMFAGTVILSQYVLYEMPPTTATLYILSTMAVIVVMVWAAVGNSLSSAVL